MHLIINRHRKNTAKTPQKKFCKSLKRVTAEKQLEVLITIAFTEKNKERVTVKTCQNLNLKRI